MFVIYHGYTFDDDGRNIPKRIIFATLEEAKEYAEKIYQRDGWILGIFQERQDSKIGRKIL